MSKVVFGLGGGGLVRFSVCPRTEVCQRRIQDLQVGQGTVEMRQVGVKRGYGRVSEAEARFLRTQRARLAPKVIWKHSVLDLFSHRWPGEGCIPLDDRTLLSQPKKT